MSGSRSGWRAPGPGHPLRVLSWVAGRGCCRCSCWLSRLYRGMHWPTDVAAAVVFTLVWLLLLRAVLLRAARERRTRAGVPTPASAASRARSPASGGDVDEHLADGAVLHGLVGGGGLGEREDVQRQPGLLADPDRAVEHGGVDVLDARAPWPARGSV